MKTLMPVQNKFHLYIDQGSIYIISSQDIKPIKNMYNA